MASHAQDDGFHEIQLNGKQLVFVFMATTVVLVVTFLCGVLVGRGVRSERTETARIAEPSADDQLRSAVDAAKPPTVQQSDDPTKAPPPAPAEGGTESAEAAAGAAAGSAAAKDANAAKAAAAGSQSAKPGTAKAKAETVKAETVKPGAAKPEPAKRELKPEPTKPEPKPELVKSEPKAEPTKSGTQDVVKAGRDAASPALPAASDNRSGWVVQVAAVKTRGEADTIAKRLNSRGYSAFVLSNSANVFRVRVGGYPSKRDADAVAAKLRKEERVTPWVTR